MMNEFLYKSSENQNKKKTSFVNVTGRVDIKKFSLKKNKIFVEEINYWLNI